MNTKNAGLCFVAFTFISVIPSAYAKGGMLDVCKPELKKFACAATTENAAHECLEKHEEHAKKDDGFSHSCYEAHETYEKQAGKVEAGHKE